MDYPDYAQHFPSADMIWRVTDGKAAWVKKDTKDDKPSFYPNIFCDPAIKQTKEYCLQTQKAIYWNNWNVFQNAYGNTQRSRYIDNRNWSNGKFDVQAFVGGKRSTKTDADKNPLMKQIDFDPVTEQSKYQDIVVGFMEDLDFEVIASTINPMAAARRENFRLSELVNLRDKQSGFAQRVDQKAGAPIMPKSNLKFPVNDEAELDLYFQLGGFKEAAEMQIELSDQIVNNDSDWKAVKKQLLKDTFNCGAIAVDCVYDKDGRMRKKYVDQANIGVEDYFGENLKRPTRIWYIELLSVQEVLLESDGQLTHDEMRTVAQMFENKFGNPSWATSNGAQANQLYVNTDSTFPYFYYDWKVPIMRSYWSELDIYKTATLTHANGTIEKRFANYSDKPEDYITPQQLATAQSPESPPPAEVDANADGGGEPGQNSPFRGLGGSAQANIVDSTIHDIKMHRYYRTSWIVNTDFIFNYGRVPFQARDPYNSTYALCPLKYYRITQQPLAERIKPWVKKIYMTCNKMDAEVARKKPSGWQINIKALENISLGQNQTFTVKHAIEMWNETGDVIYSDEAVGDEFGRTKNKQVVTPLPQQGFIEAMNAYVMLINFYKQQIVNLTGINEFMDATTPNSATPAAVAKMAVQGTKNSMSQIAGGMLNIAEKSAMDVTERIRQIVAEQGDYSGYADALGTGISRIVTVTNAVIMHRFALKLQAKPTATERDEMKQAIYQAFSNMATPEQGGLWVTDALKFQEMINEGTNYKVIRLMMSATIKEKLAMLQQQRMQLIQQQTDSLNNSKLTADQSELKKYALMKEVDLRYEQGLTFEINKRNQFDLLLKGNNKIISDTHKADLKTREKMLEMQAA